MFITKELIECGFIKMLNTKRNYANSWLIFR